MGSCSTLRSLCLSSATSLNFSFSLQFLHFHSFICAFPTKPGTFPPKSRCEFSTWRDPLCHTGVAGTKPHQLHHSKRGGCRNSSWGPGTSLCCSASLSWAGCASAAIPQLELHQNPTGMSLPLHSGESFPALGRGTFLLEMTEVTQGLALRLQHHILTLQQLLGVKHPQRAWKPKKKIQKIRIGGRQFSKQVNLKFRSCAEP